VHKVQRHTRAGIDGTGNDSLRASSPHYARAMWIVFGVAAMLLGGARADDPTYTVYANLGSIFNSEPFASQGNSADLYPAGATIALGVSATTSSTCTFGSYAFAVYQNTSQTGWK
jgi:hypothetical protein